MSRNKKGDIETNYEVRSFDRDITPEEYGALPKHPLHIVLDNLRSAFNVGSIFRLCDTMRVSGLHLCGCTAHPPHIKLDKTSLGTTGFVPWRYHATTVDAVTTLKGEGVAVFAAETASHSTDYRLMRYPQPVALVLGNEALGVSRDVLDVCDGIVEIPHHGFKNSINVATACAVLGFRVLEAWGV